MYFKNVHTKSQLAKNVLIWGKKIMSSFEVMKTCLLTNDYDN